MTVAYRLSRFGSLAFDDYAATHRRNLDEVLAALAPLMIHECSNEDLAPAKTNQARIIHLTRMAADALHGLPRRLRSDPSS